MNTIVTYTNKLKVEEVFATTKGTGRSFPHTLIIKPGIYIFGDNSYELIREGLYRFVSIDKDTMAVKHSFQQIVYEKDNFSLVCSLLNCIYDRNITVINSKRVEFLLNSSNHLVDTNGFEFLLFYLDELKIPSRQIHVYSQTADVVVHKFLEVWDELSSSWRLIDPVYGILLKNLNYCSLAKQDFFASDFFLNLENIAYVKRDVDENMQLWMHNFQFNYITYRHFLNNENLLFVFYNRPKDEYILSEIQAAKLQDNKRGEIKGLGYKVMSEEKFSYYNYELPQIHIWTKSAKYIPGMSKNIK